MTNNTAKQHISPEHDPNITQGKASNPLDSVWVGASAGTGKTKVLTDRVLRLMLPRAGMGSESATLPHKILCLTFTKAAASEMSQRIYQKLSEWSVMDDDKLHSNLTKLTGAEVTQDVMNEARKLFAKVLDTPGGLKIMTIHSFCQSVLKRFPIEAGLSPHFELVDEQEAIEYLTRSLHDIIRESKLEPDTKTARSFKELTLHLNADDMSDLMQQIMSKRSKLSAIIAEQGDELVPNLYNGLGVDEGDSEKTITANIDKINIRKAIEPLLSSATKGDKAKAQLIQDWCDSKIGFDEYKHAYIKTSADEFYKDFASKKIRENYPEIIELLVKEANNVWDAKNKLKALKQAKLNEALLNLSSTMLGRYEAYKQMHDRLDYDDLVIKTSQLLSTKQMTQWVLYKLDTGIDHILVDEAQDNSRAQWKIVKALSEEFFEEFGSRENIIRTLFVVGDEKQSIYSFQGADVEEFNRMHQFLEGKIKTVNMNYSFRSTSAVLGAVDDVFNTEHLVFRAGQAGLVELWPLIEQDEQTQDEVWKLPSEIVTGNSPKEKMAEKLATTIQGWVKNKEILKSKNRPIKPSDIMVLVQSRGEFVELLMRALKSKDVPVAGFDRLKLMDEIAIIDILALAKFALLPKDDLNLAALLKSPLIGLNEDELYNICQGRNGALWLELRKKNKEVADYLYQWIEKAIRLTPYEFFVEVLHSASVANEISGKKAFLSRLGYEVLDAFDEFLNLCLHYEQSHIPNLQSFVDWFEKSPSEIKREQEGGELDLVRIMTVHGSKGLQAPIVILPDAARKGHDHNRARIRLLWPEDATGVPLWASRKDYESEIYTQKREIEVEKQEAEYRRLLYVAMTRAEDRLYITGFKGVKEVKEDCWYSLIKSSFPEDSQELEDGTLRFERAQEVAVASKEAQVKEQYNIDALPSWAYLEAGAEPVPPKPLAPSKIDEEEPALDSPLAKAEEWKFSRGNIVHKLLEVLPDIDKAKWGDAIGRYLARASLAIPKKSQENLKQEILSVLNHPEFSELFSANSQAEVPITGVIGGNVISGTIDRLVVTETQVMIVDYKSNRESPKSAEDIAVLYLKQLAAYISLIRKIYPDKEAKAALLWTEKPILMPVSNNLLDPYYV